MILRAAAVGLALATASGGVALAVRDPWPVPPVTGAAAALRLPAATAAVTCPGPETGIAPDGSPARPAAGPVTLTAADDGTGDAATLGPLATLPDAPTGTRLTGYGRARVLERLGGVAGPLRLAAAPGAAAATRLGAVQTTFARTGDRRGLAAAACPAATTDAWLVGGSTATGRRARLLLVDPTPAAAVVDVTVLGPRGPVDLPSARGLVVAAGRARALQLDALAPGLDRLAVHVVARRGRIAAVLDDSRLDGATPAGVDDVPVTAAPSRHVTVPGVLLPAAPAGTTVSGAVRLAVPGTDDAVVRLRVAGPHGALPIRGGAVTVPAGSVVDVPLTGLAPGGYAVLADADVPVVAGAVVRVAGLPAGPLRHSPTDFGWTAATPPVTGNALAALPRPVEPAPVGVGPVPAGSILLLTSADRGAAVVVRQAGQRGEPLGARTVHVAAHRTAMVALLPAAAAVTLQLDGGQQAWAGVAVAVRDPAGPLLTLLAVGPPVAAQAAAVAAVADPWLTGKPATGPVRVGSAR